MIQYGRQSVDAADIEAVAVALGGDWLTQGPTVERFECAVANYVGAVHAVAFSSGTAALHAACAAAGLGSGDVVVTSPLTFMASANCARFVGATPALVDIDAATLNLDLSAVPSSAAAVVAVHYAGLPVDLDGAAWAARPRVVIEDASHALGASTPAGPIGNCAFSDMCCFSFHPVKPITTGEGGMVTTNNDELAARLRRFRSHDIVRMPERGEWYYEIDEVGFNYRLTDIQAALGFSQLSKLDTFIATRNDIASRYREALSDMPLVLPPRAAPGFYHGYHLFPIRVRNRAEVFRHLRSLGVGVQVHYVPIHHHPISRDIGLQIGDLPVCDGTYDELISLPIHPGMTDAHVEAVVAAVAQSLELFGNENA